VSLALQVRESRPGTHSAVTAVGDGVTPTRPEPLDDGVAWFLGPHTIPELVLRRDIGSGMVGIAASRGEKLEVRPKRRIRVIPRARAAIKGTTSAKIAFTAGAYVEPSIVSKSERG